MEKKGGKKWKIVRQKRQVPLSYWTHFGTPASALFWKKTDFTSEKNWNWWFPGQVQNWTDRSNRSECVTASNSWEADECKLCFYHGGFFLTFTAPWSVLQPLHSTSSLSLTVLVVCQAWGTWAVVSTQWPSKRVRICQVWHYETQGPLKPKSNGFRFDRAWSLIFKVIRL